MSEDHREIPQPYPLFAATELGACAIIGWQENVFTGHRAPILVPLDTDRLPKVTGRPVDGPLVFSYHAFPGDARNAVRVRRQAEVRQP